MHDERDQGLGFVEDYRHNREQDHADDDFLLHSTRYLLPLGELLVKHYPSSHSLWAPINKKLT